MIPSTSPNASRLITSLERSASLPRGAVGRAGVSVVAEADRAGSQAVSCYRIGDHLLAWCDPVLEHELRGALDDRPPSDLASALASIGLRFATSASFYLDPDTPEMSELGATYHHRPLGIDDVDMVRAFTERCDPDDVEAAALDDLDTFAEIAISTVVTPDPASDHIVAYASALAWDWDNGFADIGVLVHPGHRHRGLGVAAVGATIARLDEQGLLPLYRHEDSNLGSAAVARALGFRRVLGLDYFTRAR